MYTVSCFILGYAVALALYRSPKVKTPRVVIGILWTVVFLAALHVVYEFRAPWPYDRDYDFYRYVIAGRYRPSAQTLALAALLGFATYLLRRPIWDALHSAGSKSPAPVDETRLSRQYRSRSLP